MQTNKYRASFTETILFDDIIDAKIISKYFDIDCRIKNNTLFFNRTVELNINYEYNLEVNDILYKIKSLTPVKNKLIFIGIDGVRSDAHLISKVSYFQKLIDNEMCAFSFYHKSIKETYSAASWTSILTGLKPKKHKIKSNKQIEDKNLNLNYSTFIDILVDFIGISCTSYISSWSGIYNILKNSSWKTNFYRNRINPDKDVDKYDTKIKEKFVNDIKNNNINDINFLYFMNVDQTGHDYGFSPNNKEYRNSIKTSMKYCKEIIKEIKKKQKENLDEDWLIVITSDHGGMSKKYMSDKLKKDYFDKYEKDINDKGTHGLKIPSNLYTILYLYEISECSISKKGEILEEPNSLDLFPTILNWFGILAPGRNLLKN
jgi:predicted AlkP superfamily pyrophosphatase or phosphodiesterase